MNAPPANIYLESCLAPFAPWLAQPDVTDLFVNRPGELWIETLGASPQRVAVPELTHELLARLVRQIAAITAQGINREHPLLAASLPTGERVQAIIPPATRGQIALAIRRHVAVNVGLDDYQLAAAEEPWSDSEITAVGEAEFTSKPIGEAAEILRRAVRERRNILISGGTASGKTTFANALIREIPSDERLVLIEDTPELQVAHENAVGLVSARGELGEAQVTADELLIASLRMRPDRIILGELRGSEAVTYLRAINTGHPGSMTTIHADSPKRAIDQLVLLVLQTGTRMAWDDVERYVRRSVDVIVQLVRVGGTRQVQSILAR